MSGYGAFGEAVYVPTYGEKGILVFLSGFLLANDELTWGSNGGAVQTLDRINIYDIASKTFMYQTAAGAVPGPRYKFCAVGVEDKSAGTFDMWVLVGIYDIELTILIAASSMAVSLDRRTR